jgi:tRNA pseudouridine38-40 synthase
LYGVVPASASAFLPACDFPALFAALQRPGGVSGKPPRHRVIGRGGSFCYIPFFTRRRPWQERSPARHMERLMRNFKLTIEYDGSGFSGWQVQPGQRTVQGKLYDALGEIATGDVRIIGSGRTDTGVHAVGQVANAELETGMTTGIMMKALRGKLPRDIFVRSVEEVPLSFNARYDARSRTYHYIFIDRPTALWRNYYHEVPQGLSPEGIEAMNAQIASIRGEHDFAPFAASGSNVKTTICNISRAEIIENRPLVTLAVTADRFLYNMMRSLAGSVLRAGTLGDVSIAGILASGDRCAAGPTLPPGALYLMEVKY